MACKRFASGISPDAIPQLRSCTCGARLYLGVATKHMLGEDMDHLPGEAYLRRIIDDGKGWQDLFNLPHVQIIIDETIRDDMPAIMMGDLNVHYDHYPNMDRMCRTFGARDAWTTVHGSATRGSETIDLYENNLTQVFGQHSTSPSLADPKGHEFFIEVAAGRVCYERECSVCEGSAEREEVSILEGQPGSSEDSEASRTRSRSRFRRIDRE